MTENAWQVFDLAEVRDKLKGEAVEYLEFLNAPETRAEIDRAATLIRVPRGPDTLAQGGDWPRGEDGYRIVADWDPQWPVLGVSFRDAERYARWLSRKNGRTYALPIRHEWTHAAGADIERPYPFGRVWRPKWVKSCYARPRPTPEPVLSYPIDESIFGVFDMTGSAAEWIHDWFDPDKKTRRLGGASWGNAKPFLFTIWGGSGAADTSVSHTYGFRLVMRK